jgi:hypothetical protein
MDATVLLIVNVGVVLVIAAIVIVVQFNQREVRNQSYLWVALLVLRGFLPPGPTDLTVAGIGLLIVGLVFSAWFGLLRGRTMPMWLDERGLVLRKGNRTTLWLWVATVAARFVVDAIGYVAFHEPFNGNALWLGVGVTLGVQQVVMGRRALVLTGSAPALP